MTQVVVIAFLAVALLAAPRAAAAQPEGKSHRIGFLGVGSREGRAFLIKRVELLKQTVARLTRVAVLSNPANKVHARMLDPTVTAAQALGLQVQRTPT